MRFTIALSLLSAIALAGELQVDPAGTFSILVPSALLPCTLSPGQLACPASNPALTISTKDTSLGASVALMALNAEDAIQNKPQFKMVRKESVMLDGYKAIVQTMTFNNLSNVTLPVMVRTLSAVAGTKAVSVEMACNQNSCEQLIPGFDEAIQSLHLAAPGKKLKGNSESSGMSLQNLLKGFKF
jgi:hypothetical protein